ncbi:hypothetical protein H0B56_00320 [Haloechinothrix sp. YIM 98757]|uniref:Uncharacterized protein n=1 Tax=Haloechinothrix aidingensis TaxID=2752311 RepID=A0A837ZV67_9PSEU|nr:hypothetical protein [Haloechinothrix aidingensis]
MATVVLLCLCSASRATRRGWLAARRRHSRDGSS